MLAINSCLVLSLGVSAPMVANAANIITVGSSISSSQTVLGSTVVPYKEVTITAQMPGKITALTGEVGSKFKKNDVLLKIDDAQLLAKRNSKSAYYFWR